MISDLRLLLIDGDGVPLVMMVVVMGMNDSHHEAPPPLSFSF